MRAEFESREGDGEGEERFAETIYDLGGDSTSWRGAVSEHGLTSRNQSRWSWVGFSHEVKTSSCQLENVVKEPQKPVVSAV